MELTRGRPAWIASLGVFPPETTQTLCGVTNEGREDLLQRLQRRGQQRGVAALCLGGGNAIAMAVERV